MHKSQLEGWSGQSHHGSGYVSGMLRLIGATYTSVMKKTREQVPLDEADFYRALIRAVESGEPKVDEPEMQPTREKAADDGWCL
jgi:hypothetical protein